MNTHALLVAANALDAAADRCLRDSADAKDQSESPRNPPRTAAYFKNQIAVLCDAHDQLRAQAKSFRKLALSESPDV